MPGRIGGAEDEDAGIVVFHAVELLQKLVDQLPPGRLLHIAAVGADGVDFVEKQHAGRIIPCILENPVQVLFTVAEVHVQDLVQAYVDEACIHLSCRRLGDHGLAAARRPVEQNAAARLLPVSGIQLGVLHGPDNLDVDLLFHMLHPAHIRKRYIGLLHELGDIVIIVFLVVVRQVAGITADAQLAVQFRIGEFGMEVEQLLVGAGCRVHIVFLQGGAGIEQEHVEVIGLCAQEVFQDDVAGGVGAFAVIHFGQADEGFFAGGFAQGFAELLLGFVEALHLQEGFGEVEAQRHIVGRVFQRLAEAVDRLL